MKDRRIRTHQPLSGRALLAQWIARHRMTQTEAAEQIGVSRVKLNQYLNDERRPSLETAIRIEDATGIGVRLWLLDDVTTGNNSGSPIAQENRQKEDTEVNHNLPTRTQTGVER